MSIFYADPKHRRGLFKIETSKGEYKTTTSVIIFVALPTILGPISCGELKMPWELHIIMRAWVDPNYTEVKRPVHPILEWLLWSYVKVINKDTSATEIDMIVVTLLSQKLKAWQKLWLEGTIVKWP